MNENKRNMILTLSAMGAVVFFIGYMLYGCRTGYVVDKGEVYWITWNEGQGHVKRLLKGADSGTFETMGIEFHHKSNRFGRDKYSVYFEDKMIPGADPKTFAPLMSRDYWKDVDRVYMFDCSVGVTPILDSDSATFKILGNGWAIDSKRAYYPNP